MTIKVEWNDCLFSECMRGSIYERNWAEDLIKRGKDQELGWEFSSFYSIGRCDCGHYIAWTAPGVCIQQIMCYSCYRSFIKPYREKAIAQWSDKLEKIANGDYVFSKKN